MRKPKVYPTTDLVFLECGCCGEFHPRGLPGSVDCRDDAHRFSFEDLDAHYGAAGWEEINLEDQSDEAHE
jgi:hypothetical protein